MLKNFDFKKSLSKVTDMFVTKKAPEPVVLPETDFRAVLNTSIQLADSNKEPVSVSAGTCTLTHQTVNDVVYLCVNGNTNCRAPRAYWQAQLDKGNISIA